MPPDYDKKIYIQKFGVTPLTLGLHLPAMDVSIKR
jgi:hypothetical protein